MVANEPQVGIPTDEFVVGRKIVCPKELFATQGNGVGNEVEEGNPDGHLNEHRQATAHGADTVFAVKLHHLCLLLHGILGFGILGIQSIYLGLENSHASTAQVALLGGGVDEDLNNDGEQKQYNAHVHAETGEEVEQGQDNPTVDDAEQRPAQIYEVLQFEVLAGCNEVVVFLEQMKIVWTEVQAEFCRLCSSWVKTTSHVC